MSGLNSANSRSTSRARAARRLAIAGAARRPGSKGNAMTITRALNCDSSKRRTPAETRSPDAVAGTTGLCIAQPRSDAKRRNPDSPPGGREHFESSSTACVEVGRPRRIRAGATTIAASYAGECRAAPPSYAPRVRPGSGRHGIAAVLLRVTSRRAPADRRRPRYCGQG